MFYAVTKRICTRQRSDGMKCFTDHAQYRVIGYYTAVCADYKSRAVAGKPREAV